MACKLSEPIVWDQNYIGEKKKGSFSKINDKINYMTRNKNEADIKFWTIYNLQPKGTSKILNSVKQPHSLNELSNI